jgi:DNA-directed RNA polymerase specialized sigma subunit
VILRLKPARREREILRLWLVEDLSDVEIGRKVKRSRETVNRVRNEWIRRIRKFLDKNPRLCDLLKGRKTLQ